MTNKLKLLALLLALCLAICILAVSCDKGGENSEAETSELAEGVEAGSETETETETEAVTSVDTIGHSSELGDDGFIKVGWGDKTEE